jgi:ferredoxin
VIVLGGGNTAMDCCRTARRLGGEDVKVIVRSPFETMKASPWEKEDAMHEDIPIIDNHVPKSFVVEDGRLKGVMFEKVEAKYDENGERSLVPKGEPEVFYPADDVLVAIGQENAFPWIERDIGLEFDSKWDMPVVDKTTFQSTHPKVFFGGDAAFGPENVITAVAHGHQAAISIDLLCHGKDLMAERLPPHVNLISQKMGIHEWAYDSEIDEYDRLIVPQAPKAKTLVNRKQEVEMGFDQLAGYKEAMRCLNCDVQTVFDAPKCIECDACVDICPTSCITFTANEEEPQLRQHTKVPALNLTQDLYVSEPVPQTARIMAKDEDVCLHCGLCAERCPTAAWDMQKFWYNVTKAGEVKYGPNGDSGPDHEERRWTAGMNVVGCVASSLLALLFVSSCNVSDNERYLVPEGFNGRVLILFNRSDGAPKEYDGRTRIYRVPESGVLKTQFAPNEVWHEFPRVFYVGNSAYELPVVMDPNSDKPKVPYACCWSLGIFQKDSSSKQVPYEDFYVGTQKQIDSAAERAEKEDLGKYTEQ